MLDLFSTDRADAQSPAAGPIAQAAAPSMGDAFTATKQANDRVEGYGAECSNQQDFLGQRMADFTRRTGEALPPLKFDGTEGNGASYDDAYRGWLGSVHSRMTEVSQARNDPTLMPPTDQDIGAGGVGMARAALQRQAQLGAGPQTFGAILGRAGAGGVQMAQSTVDPSNPLNALALTLAPEGGALLASALRMGGSMAGAQLYGDLQHYGYRQQIDPNYGARDVATDVAGAFAGGALFGAGHVLGGEGLRGSLGAAAGGAVGGGGIGYLQGGEPGALEGAIGGAAVPLAGASFGLTSRGLGMAWRGLVGRAPELAADMPLEVRDAGAVAEKAGDIQAQNPYHGVEGEAAHAAAVAKIEADVSAGRAPELPPAAAAESQVRRGQVFFPGGAIDAPATSCRPCTRSCDMKVYTVGPEEMRLLHRIIIDAVAPGLRRSARRFVARVDAEQLVDHVADASDVLLEAGPFRAVGLFDRTSPTGTRRNPNTIATLIAFATIA